MMLLLFANLDFEINIIRKVFLSRSFKLGKMIEDDE